jgi:hypothetical protein
MVIAASGTFDYVAVVPDRWRNGTNLMCRLRDDGTFENQTVENRLVGHAPTLEIRPIGLTPDARISPFTGTARPKVMLSRMVLRAKDKAHASVASFSFCVDQELTTVLSPADTLFLSRTGCGGIGLSILRSGTLVAAVGAVSAVPQGQHDSVRLPYNLVRKAEATFTTLDPLFAFPEVPVDVQIGDHRRLIYRGRPRIGDYAVFVEHGFYPGTPGTDECASISLIGSCPDVAAIASAQLLEYRDLSDMVRW